LGVLPVLALVVLFTATGLRGVDFGYHWDEPDFHLAPARHMIESGVLLPKNYTYPTVDKWLVLLPSIPLGIRTAVHTGGEPAPVQAAMLAAINASDYLLRARSVFIVVSSLAILWTYGAARALRHRRREALVAAGSLGLSWQFAYHARWAVTDCILVQFSALTLFMLALFHGTGKPRWLYAAAVAAGLSTGTKYTGVALLAATLVAGALSLPRDAYATQLRRAAELCALAFGVYLLTTPGTVLEPFQFRTDTLYISRYYEHHTHGGYTVASAWEHAKIVVSYLALAFYSP
jgi:4-amino-4-deoxy-L-arabinose transferase-like glycosyltransferase